MHQGIDIANSVGTPIYAAKAGTVTRTVYQPGGYGKVVYIDCGDGVVTIYGHNSKIYVNVGQYVERGDSIALMGNTGRSTGPHCHFEIRIDESAVNPLEYLPKPSD